MGDLWKPAHALRSDSLYLTAKRGAAAGRAENTAQPHPQGVPESAAWWKGCHFCHSVLP